VIQGVESLTDIDLTPCEELLQELRLREGEIHETGAKLRSLLLEPGENAIYWATVPVSRDHVDEEAISLHCAPLHVGELVDQHLFHSKRMVVLTSATLQTEGSFDYIRERLHAWDATELAVGSPFDYLASTLLCLPTDVPEPNQPYHQRQVEAALTLVCHAMEGRTLALFTSYSQLHHTARAIAGPLGEADISVYAQGQGASRQQLLENFRANSRSVLLGTSSFWEGVDVVGEALSCLVIAKLPFAVPTDPIIAARSETFDDPFGQYAVPQAILRFRQGFGRLIRSKTDRGVVLVLDRRLQTKFYGQAFLDSLPQCTIWRGQIAQLPQSVGRWLAR
jgi:DNA polymerase-3 subunit epsilon/ATP-dependent DNA helicase DinG